MKSENIEFEFNFFDTYFCGDATGIVKVIVRYNYNGKKSDEAILSELKNEIQKQFQSLIDSQNITNMAVIQGNQPGYGNFIINNVKTDAEIESISFLTIKYSDASLTKVYEYKNSDHSNDPKCVVPEKKTTTEQKTIDTTSTSSDGTNYTPFIIGGVLIAIVVIAAVCLVVKKKKID